MRTTSAPIFAPMEPSHQTTQSNAFLSAIVSPMIPLPTQSAISALKCAPRVSMEIPILSPASPLAIPSLIFMQRESKTFASSSVLMATLLRTQTLHVQISVTLERMEIQVQIDVWMNVLKCKTSLSTMKIICAWQDVPQGTMLTSI